MAAIRFSALVVGAMFDASWCIGAQVTAPVNDAKADVIPFERAEDFPEAAFALIARARVVWLGELHGTKEAPQLLLGLVRLISHCDQPPVVALEIPFGDQTAIDDFLQSGEEAILKTHTFFKADPTAKDGRTSEAMAGLLSALRHERVAKVVCIDPSPDGWEHRDQGMATRIAECVERFPGAKIVVLTGNVHSRVTEGTPWNKQYQPAAFLLGKKVEAIVTFDLHFERGKIWARTKEGFGEHRVFGPHWAGQENYYISLGSKPEDGHWGIIFSRKVSASPPWPDFPG